MTEPLPIVFVVDDDASVRKSLMRLLASAGYRTESFPSADVFLERWEAEPAPGCLLLDLRMPGLDGLELQRKLEASPHALPIIFITGYGDVPSSVEAMKAGAVDFLSKPFQEQDLLRAVGEAIRRDGRQRSERRGCGEVLRLFETLTPREREVMALVVQGMLNKQIAFDLGISEKTVKIHRGRVMAKMRAPSVAELVRAADRIGPRSGSAPPTAK